MREQTADAPNPPPSPEPSAAELRQQLYAAFAEYGEIAYEVTRLDADLARRTAEIKELRARYERALAAEVRRG